MFVHIVLFWLKEDAPASAQRELLEGCQTLLKPIPGLTYYSAGRPAMTPREVVDNSYSVGLCTVFADKAGHDAYQVHPNHQEFLAKFKPLWKRVQVYDFA